MKSYIPEVVVCFHFYNSTAHKIWRKKQQINAMPLSSLLPSTHLLPDSPLWSWSVLPSSTSRTNTSWKWGIRLYLAWQSRMQASAPSMSFLGKIRVFWREICDVLHQQHILHKTRFLSSLTQTKVFNNGHNVWYYTTGNTTGFIIHSVHSHWLVPVPCLVNPLDFIFLSYARYISVEWGVYKEIIRSNNFVIS